jgi:hypothetical protein
MTSHELARIRLGAGTRTGQKCAGHLEMYSGNIHLQATEILLVAKHSWLA